MITPGARGGGAVDGRGQDNLFEGQLFGYRRGAFTGAMADHAEVIRAADGGTLCRRCDLTQRTDCARLCESG